MKKNKTILDCWSKYAQSQKCCSSSTPLSREAQEVNHQSEQDDEHTSQVDNQSDQCDPIQVENQSEQCDPMQVENQSDNCDQTQVDNQTEHESPFIPSQNQNQDDEDDEDEDELDFLPHDPGKRNPISAYPVNVRDLIRRGFIDKKACRPKPKEDFPQTLEGTKKRRFKYHWFDRYDWLEYSEKNDAAFCFVCYLFRDSTTSPGNDPFVDGGFRKWRKALERFDRHVGGVSSAHNEAKEKFDLFINQKTSIMEKIDKVSSKSKALYKARLIYSLQCLRFLLKQGLAFRGHNEKESSNNKGNFRELLAWLAGRSESVAKIVLTNAPGNHQVTAPKIQKDLIKCCAKETTRLIVEDLDNDFFSILADESCDVSQTEQLALCLRYVNKKGKVCESFLGVVKVDDTTSVTLMAAIKDVLDGHSLSMSNIRGQGYDGASNMRGELNGLRNLIMRNNPHAYYVHCFAHQLQLTLVAVAKENCECAKFFMHLGIVLNTIGSSCKRMEMLRDVQAKKLLEALDLGEVETGKGLNQVLGLARPGDTRWGSHFKSILNLIVLFSTAIEVLEKIGLSSKCVDDRAKAQIAIDHLESFDFIFMMHLMKVVFGYTNDLCQALQRRDQDIINAMTLVDLTKDHLQIMRDDGWDNFFDTVSDFCGKHNIEVPNMNDFYAPPGRSRRFLGKVTNLHRYRIDMFMAVIDKQYHELESRFDEKSTELLKCMACLSPANLFASFNKKKLLELAEEFYPKEFSSVDIIGLSFQLDLYIRDMRKDSRFHHLKNIGGLLEKLIETNKHLSYPSLCLLLKLVLILPVATASVERAFSSMTFVKNKLRNKLSNKLLNYCLVPFIERDVFVQVSDDDIINRFQNMKSRRMVLD